MRQTHPALFLLAATLAALPLAAAAQQDPREQQATPVRPAEPQQAEPAPGSDEGSGSSLSDRLSRSHGVVQPPATGDRGVLPPPPAGTGSTPIIRPPGAGGEGPVQPK
jgi:hypothetical protein